MAYLAALLGSIALFCGFVALTRFELARGTRVFAAARARFDARAERVAFLATHIDFEALVRDEGARALVRAGHAVAHRVWRVVRAAERQLAQAVQALRKKNPDLVARDPEHARTYVKTLSSFKENLPAQPQDDSETSTR